MTNDSISERISGKLHIRGLLDLARHEGFEYDPGEYHPGDRSKNRPSGYIYKAGGLTFHLRFNIVWRVKCLELGEIAEMTHRPINQIREALDGWADTLKSER